MGKLVADAVLDASLQYLEDNVTWISVCEGAATSYENAHSNKGTGSGMVLAHSATVTFTGPAEGDASGRKTAIDAVSAMAVDVAGTADHITLCDTVASALLYVTTCSSQALATGNTVTAPTWDIEIADPT